MTEIPKGYVMPFREGFFDKKDLVNLVRSLKDTVYENPSEDDNLDFIFIEWRKSIVILQKILLNLYKAIFSWPLLNYYVIRIRPV
jgi:hypothetical protein